METREFVWTRGHVVALVALCLAQVLDAVDSTVVNVALPAIKDELAFSAADLSWVVNAYMVPFGGFLLLGGRLGDLFGHRRVLMGGIALFTGASLVAGLAPSAGVLVGARGVQGLAAALVAPMTLAMITLIFPEGRPRSRALAVWGTATAVSSALGLVAGGLLADGPGWRWIFFINVPIGVLLVVAGRVLPARGEPRSSRGFDAVGAVTVTVGVGLLIYAVLRAEWGLLLVGAALLGYFAVHENAVARRPLVDFGVFRIRSVAGANLIQVVRASALFGLFYLATLFMQEVLGFSALETGLAYVPMTVVMVGASWLGPLLVRRLGARPVLGFGALVAAAGLLPLAWISPAAGLFASLIVPMVVVGAGHGIMVVPLTDAALSGVPSSDGGVAAALLNVSAQLGGALGLAVLATAAAARTDDRLRAGTSLSAALTDGYGLAFVMSAVLMALCAALAITFFPGGKDPAA
ncbi:MFS transporter [Nonomuraea aurantiaca]|uniref:MFS transporter n=1 Tax=Nonomuraea aurantiaca TaxID=2878562 RepID=UPI001CD922B7|nr:MFS transporter [Nonomuraea aurantiaca]MCA2222497.1 MFS transporter [Nonomuraea aurantiaca]